MWSLPAALHLPGVALLQPRRSPAESRNRGPESAGPGASILGVGHFTVPPDAGVKDAACPPVPSGDVSRSWSSIRTIVVPHGIAAVPRRSPIKARKRTPWRSEAHGAVARGGSREWLTDRVFVESTETHLRGAWTTSAMVHAGLVILVLLLLLVARGAANGLTPRPRMNTSLSMPASLSLMPVAVALPPVRTPVQRSSPAPGPLRQAPPTAAPSEVPTAVPLKTSTAVEAETAIFDEATTDGTAFGAEAGGVLGGSGNGLSAEAAPPSPKPNVPYRVGDGIARPRKIKDFKPVYPAAAMAAHVVGTVLIEATIGADGKVHEARVVRSVAALDQAALDAVRQWEYEPSRIDGVAVAVSMVIVVTFALL